MRPPRGLCCALAINCPLTILATESGKDKGFCLLRLVQFPMFPSHNQAVQAVSTLQGCSASIVAASRWSWLPGLPLHPGCSRMLLETGGCLLPELSPTQFPVMSSLLPWYPWVLVLRLYKQKALTCNSCLSRQSSRAVPGIPATL